MKGRPICPLYPASTETVTPVSDEPRLYLQGILPLSKTRLSELAGAAPPDQFWAFVKSLGPVAGDVFVIVNVAPPLVATVIVDGLPSVSPEMVIDV